MSDTEDVLYADTPTLDALTAALPPVQRTLRRGGGFEIDDLQVIPSLPQRLELLDADGADLLDEAVAAFVPEQEVIAFCANRQLELDQVLALLRRDEPYSVLIRKGLLQNILLNIRGYQEGDPSVVDFGVPLPVAELHSPPLAGCSSSYTVAAGHVRDAALHVGIRGVGAGSGISATLRFEDRLFTTGQCGQITIPGTVSITPWVNPDTGHTFFVVSVGDISAGEWSLTEIPADRLHLCGARYEEILSSCTEQARRGWMRAGRDYFRHEIAVAGGIEHKRALQHAREFSITLGRAVEMHSRFSSEYTYAYVVAGRADYVGFFEHPRSEAFFWAWRER